MISHSNIFRLLLWFAIIFSSAARGGEYWLLEDSSGQLSLTDVISKEASFKLTTDSGIGLSRSAFWLKITKSNLTAQPLEQTLQFHSHALASDSASVSVFDESGAAIPSNGSALPSFNTDTPARQSRHLYARIQSDTDINFDHTVLTRAEAQNNVIWHTKLYSILFGALLTLLLYNVTNVFINRDSSSFYYCAFLFFGATTIAIDANFLAGIERHWIGATGTSVLVAGAAFLCSILTIPQQWLRALRSVWIVLIALHWLTPAQLSFSIFLNISSPLLLLLTTGLIIFAWYQASPFRAWLITAWFCLISGSLLTLGATHGVLANDFLPSYAIGNVFESIILASTLAVRLRLSQRRNEILLDRLQQRHHVDPVTGLPSRIALEARVDQTNERASADKDYTAALLLLDDAQNIRQSYNNHIADELTEHIGRQVTSVVGEQGSACILDRNTLFVISPSTSTDDIQACTDKLKRAINNTIIEVNGLTVSSTVSIGACFWATGEELDTVLPIVESLAVKAQRSGEGSVKVLSNLIDKDLEILDAQSIQSALQNNEIAFHLEPVFNAEFNRPSINSFVATLHWNRPMGRQTKSNSWNEELNQLFMTPKMHEELHLLREKVIKAIADKHEPYVVWNVSSNLLKNPTALALLIDSLRHLQRTYSIDQAIQIPAHELPRSEGEDSWPAVAFEKLRNAAIGVGLSGFGIEPHGLDSLSQLKLNFVRLSPEIYSIYKKTPLLLRSIALLCKQYRVDLIAPDVTSPVTARRLRASGITLQQGKLYPMPCTQKLERT